MFISVLNQVNCVISTTTCEWPDISITVQYSIQTINKTGITVLNCSTVTKTTVGQCSQLSHWLCKPLGAVSTNIVRV